MTSRLNTVITQLLGDGYSRDVLHTTISLMVREGIRNPLHQAIILDDLARPNEFRDMLHPGIHVGKSIDLLFQTTVDYYTARNYPMELGPNSPPQHTPGIGVSSAAGQEQPQSIPSNLPRYRPGQRLHFTPEREETKEPEQPPVRRSVRPELYEPSSSSVLEEPPQRISPGRTRETPLGPSPESREGPIDPAGNLSPGTQEAIRAGVDESVRMAIDFMGRSGVPRIGQNAPDRPHMRNLMPLVLAAGGLGVRAVAYGVQDRLRRMGQDERQTINQVFNPPIREPKIGDSSPSMPQLPAFSQEVSPGMENKYERRPQQLPFGYNQYANPFRHPPLINRRGSVQNYYLPASGRYDFVRWTKVTENNTLATAY